MPPTPQNKTRFLLAQVFKGYSTFQSEEFGKIFIRHLRVSDASDSDFQQDYFYQYAQKSGLPSHEEREKYLIESGSWDPNKNIRITELKSAISSLNSSRSKFFREEEKKALDRQSKSYSDELEKLVHEKSLLFELTIETFVAKKINEYFVSVSLYKDEKLSNKVFSDEDFEDLSDLQLSKLVGSYNKIISTFNEKSLKQVAVSTFFLNLFFLCDNNAFVFYGKPIVELTFFQNELFGLGRYFKSILTDSENKPPEDCMEDAEKLVDWYESSKNLKETLGKRDPSTLVNVSQKDREKFNIPSSQNFSRLAEEAKKHGGSLNAVDIMRIDKLKV